MSFICIDFCAYGCTNTSLPLSSFPFLLPSLIPLSPCVCINSRNQYQISPSIILLFFKTRYPLNPEFINFDRIATQQTLVTLPLPLPNTGIVDTVFSLHFYMDVGDLNSGPTVHVTSTLSTELFLYPLTRQGLLFHLYR